MPNSAQLLDKFQRDHARNGTDIELGMRPPYLELLAKLGEPHKRLPPVFHVAGTNGKGSVCAFLRAMLEAAGKTVHVYTSPHLVRFHERIRIAGKLIEEDELCDLLEECEKLAPSGALTLFEVATAATLAAFARYPADYAILEVGLGGRLDATNVIDKPLASLITRLSFDHREYLGDTMERIAAEKAGIMRQGIPCYAAAQPDEGALRTLREKAKRTRALLRIAGEDWQTRATPHGFRYEDATQSLDLPLPSLTGEHQIANAGLAIAALLGTVHEIYEPDEDKNLASRSESKTSCPRRRASTSRCWEQGTTPQEKRILRGQEMDARLRGHDVLRVESIAQGLRKTEWPARLQRIGQGPLAKMLPKGWELWLDGGHNDSAGEVLARQAQRWREADGLPLTLVCGMIATKRPREFLAPLAPYVDDLVAIAIPDERSSLPAQSVADEARICGIQSVRISYGLVTALVERVHEGSNSPRRILICGSLYLAGKALESV